MALTPEQISGLRDAFAAIAEPINTWLLQDAAERIAAAGALAGEPAGKMTATAAYEIYRAKALGESQRDLKKFLKRQLGLSNREIRRLFKQAARMSRDNDEERVGFTSGADLDQMTTAAIKLAQQDFTNLTQTLGMMAPGGKVLPLRQFYQKSMDFAFEQIFTGAADYETAIRQATTKMADAGVRTIDYASGRSTSLEAAVRRNMMGGMGLLDEQITQVNHDALGCNGWEISAHANSAPDHEPIQGRQYSDREFKALESRLVRRIGTLNCGHVKMPILLGINSPQYTEEQLRAFQEDNAKGITYEGKHYTGYEATQKQRQLECAQRVQKNRILVSRSTGDALREQTAQIRLQMLNQHYKAFSKAAGLPLQQERAWVAGYGVKSQKEVRFARGNSQSTESNKNALEPQKKIATKENIQLFTDVMEAAGYKVEGFVDYDIDIRSLTEMQKVYEKMAEIYPEEAKGLKLVYDDGDIDTFGWYDPSTRSIHFNRKIYADYEEASESYDELVKTGHFPQNTDVRGSFYHEFGHAWGYYRNMQSYIKPAKKVVQKLKNDWVNKKQLNDFIQNQLSFYAISENGYVEVIAESFSEWYNSNKPRAFCKEYMEEVGAI